jgi:hypothetical protein
MRLAQRLSVRVAIPGVSIRFPCSGSSPSSTLGAPPSGLLAETSDVVLVLNQSEGAFVGCRATLAGDLLLQAVQIRVYGPGKLISPPQAS